MMQAILTSAERILHPLDISAELLLLKRRAFEHEAEVRVIIASRGVEFGRRILKIPFDPNMVFDELTFDPRLVPSEREERKLYAQSLGYTGPFNDSDLYS